VGLMLEYLYSGNFTLEKDDLTPPQSTASQNPTFGPGNQNYPNRTSSSSQPQQITLANQFGQGVSTNAAAYNSYGRTTSQLFSNPNQSSASFLRYDIPNPPITIPSASNKSASAKNLIILSAIYVTAEKYDVQPLKTLAKGKYEALLPIVWNTEQFVESLKLIYDGTPDTNEPDGLRELAIRTAAIHAKELLDRGEFLNLCRERGDFATDVLKATLNPALASGADGLFGKKCRVNATHPILVSTSSPFSAQSGSRYSCGICHTSLN